MKDIVGREFHPTEMYRLINLLIEKKKNFKVEELWDCPCVRFYNENGLEIGDAVCHSGSYGHENGLLEIMGLGVCMENAGDDVEGWLTAEEVLERLEAFLAN